jgi:two-component system OmpR family response regulator
MRHDDDQGRAEQVDSADSPVHHVLRHGDIEIDCTVNRATVRGDALELTHAEYALLEYFMAHRNRLITRTELLARVWSTPGHKGSNVVDVVVCRLRKRLGIRGRMIETVRGLGYRLHAD